MRSLQLALAALFVTGAAHAQTLQATLFKSGFSGPIFVTAPPGDLQRLFVVEQFGKIRIIKNGNTLASAYLDLGTTGLNKITAGGEQGLLGLAFHPNYASNGYFYVNYTAIGTGSTVVERYQVSAGNADLANTASGLPLITIGQPQSNHNGGCLQFGGDGKLYVGMGDGGGGNDTGSGHAPEGNGQSPATLLGKMLRLDVDLPAPYVPPDNPYVGAGLPLDEIWHFGVRNPWRFSFDRLTGDMWIGDVGQGAIEEVDFIPAGTGGLNLGWRCMEGLNCTGLSGCTCNDPALTLPVQQYSHSLGCSITGGYVYRGTNVCGLQGTYFYADYCTTRIWSFEYVNGQVVNAVERTAELEPSGTPTINNISSFGEDGAGELYICDHGDGEIYRIDPSGGLVDCNQNGTSDFCDIQNGLARDCNQNDVPDTCDIASGTDPDCNANSRPDSCDIAQGFSLDVNQNGQPDECECQGGAPPSTYCSAKLNSQFCLPAIAFSGYPSLSGTTPFVVRASNIINQKNGLLFYGYASNNAPFQGGTMCVLAPTRRTPVQNSAGSTFGIDCTGTFTFDMSAWITAGNDPLLQIVGQAFFCQYWSRDPQDAFFSSTTDAVEAHVCQ